MRTPQGRAPPPRVGQGGSARILRRSTSVIALLYAMVTLPLAAASAAVPSATLTVPLADGTGKLTPGSGMATKAALDNPRCTVNDRTGPYGRFNGPTVGGRPVCVRPFKAGEDNGGATSQGVTKDKISVVYVLGHIPERVRSRRPTSAPGRWGPMPTLPTTCCSRSGSTTRHGVVRSTSSSTRRPGRRDLSAPTRSRSGNEALRRGRHPQLGSWCPGCRARQGEDPHLRRRDVVQGRRGVLSLPVGGGLGTARRPRSTPPSSSASSSSAGRPSTPVATSRANPASSGSSRRISTSTSLASRKPSRRTRARSPAKPPIRPSGARTRRDNRAQNRRRSSPR